MVVLMNTTDTRANRPSWLDPAAIAFDIAYRPGLDADQKRAEMQDVFKIYGMTEQQAAQVLDVLTNSAAQPVAVESAPWLKSTFSVLSIVRNSASSPTDIAQEISRKLACSLEQAAEVVTTFDHIRRTIEGVPKQPLPVINRKPSETIADINFSQTIEDTI